MDAYEKRVREERASVYDGMVAIMEKVKAENRDPTPEERKDFDSREERLQDLQKDLDRCAAIRRHEESRQELAETRGVSRDESDSVEKRHERVFLNWLRRGLNGLDTADRELMLSTRAVLDASAMTTSQADTAKAGYTIPQGFWQNLQVALKAYGGLLQKCNIIQTSTGQPMVWPTIDPTGVIGSYITEANQAGFTDFVFGQGTLNAWTITSGVILASLQVIQDSVFDVESFVRERIAMAIGRKIAAELMTGSGSSAMQGIVTALTARGVVAGAAGGVYQPVSGSTVYTLGGGATAVHKLTAGIPGFDDLALMVAKVDPAYRALGNCSWVMDDNALQGLRQVTDAYGHPLWQPSVQVDSPDMVMGYPVLIDQNVGDISTTASTVGGLMFGDFSRALVVRQVAGGDVMRLDERYADYLQVGFLGFIRIDSRSNDLRAAVVYKSPAT